MTGEKISKCSFDTHIDKSYLEITLSKLKSVVTPRRFSMHLQHNVWQLYNDVSLLNKVSAGFLWICIWMIVRDGSRIQRDSFPGAFARQDIRCDVNVKLWPNEEVGLHFCCHICANLYVSKCFMDTFRLLFLYCRTRTLISFWTEVNHVEA